MKTEIFAEIYNPITADKLFRLRKSKVDITGFINSDIFASAFGCACDVYLNSLL